MVIKHHVRARDIGQIGCDIPISDVDLAILHVLGVDKSDVIDQVEVLEKYRTHQSVKVAACNEAKRVAHKSVLCSGARPSRRAPFVVQPRLATTTRQS